MGALWCRYRHQHFTSTLTPVPSNPQLLLPTSTTSVQLLPPEALRCRCCFHCKRGGCGEAGMRGRAHWTSTGPQPVPGTAIKSLLYRPVSDAFRT
jgi:hypothetical protein